MGLGSTTGPRPFNVGLTASVSVKTGNRASSSPTGGGACALGRSIHPTADYVPWTQARAVARNRGKRRNWPSIGRSV